MNEFSKEILPFPDGEYDGKWSGYMIELMLYQNRTTYVFSTINGIRGINEPVVVEIKDHRVTNIELR